MARPVAIISATAALALAVIVPAPAPARPLHTHVSDSRSGGWTANVDSAKRFARGRAGGVRFAFIDPYGRSHQLNGAQTAPMASLFKTLLLATYLSRPSVRHRSLHGWERALLNPMIRRSDSSAATRVRDLLGPGPIIAMAHRAGMQDFSYNPVWGLSRTSSRDQAKFFYHWDRFVPERHQAYARYLLSHIVPSQRWGVGRARPSGWSLFFKGGWAAGTGRVNHQTAFLEHSRCRVAVSVMTEFSPDHHYGSETIEGVSERLLDGINQINCGPRIQHGHAHAHAHPEGPADRGASYSARPRSRLGG